MSTADGVSGNTTLAPWAEVGRITCEAASQHTLEAAGLSGAEAARPYLAVTVPVSVRFPAPRTDADLLVTAELCAPRGHHPPVACGPSPSADYTDVQLTKSGSVSVKPAVVDVRGELGRTRARQELVRDVTGVGTSRLEWTISGQRRQLPGSQEFRFLVPWPTNSCDWVEVRAELRTVRGLRPRSWRTPRPGSGHAPLLADMAPQAPATLVLHEGRTAVGRPLFVGRPLNMALVPGPDHCFLVRTTGRDGAAGVLRWSDDTDGRPGYLWLPALPGPVVLRQVGGEVRRHEQSVLLENGDVLCTDVAGPLHITYERPPDTPRRTLRNCLDLRVTVDGAEISSYTTASDYVTVGRSHRDIDIDRPDISRSHGALELDNNGWAYVHRSAAVASTIVRDGVPVARLERGDSTPVRSGDEVQLTERVSLFID